MFRPFDGATATYRYPPAVPLNGLSFDGASTRHHDLVGRIGPIAAGPLSPRFVGPARPFERRAHESDS